MGRVEIVGDVARCEMQFFIWNINYQGILAELAPVISEALMNCFEQCSSFPYNSLYLAVSGSFLVAVFIWIISRMMISPSNKHYFS